MSVMSELENVRYYGYYDKVSLVEHRYYVITVITTRFLWLNIVITLLRLLRQGFFG